MFSLFHMFPWKNLCPGSWRQDQSEHTEAYKTCGALFLGQLAAVENLRSSSTCGTVCAPASPSPDTFEVSHSLKIESKYCNICKTQAVVSPVIVICMTLVQSLRCLQDGAPELSFLSTFICLTISDNQIVQVI